MNFAKRLVLVVTVLLGLAAPVGARTWRVERDGSGDFTAIQPALDRAASGDTVRIGAGRYTEFTSWPTGDKKWPENVYAVVHTDSLTLVGDGSGSTIIGPPSRIHQNTEFPKAILVLPETNNLSLVDVGLENVHDGMWSEAHGQLRVDHCEMRGCNLGLATMNSSAVVISRCAIMDCLDEGIVTDYPTQQVVIGDSQFSSVYESIHIAFNHTANATVTNCLLQAGQTGIQYWYSYGTISSCALSGISAAGVVLYDASTVALIGTAIHAGRTSAVVGSSCLLTGTNNILGGGAWETIRTCTGQIDIHGSHILKGSGPSFRADCNVDPPDVHINLTNNYWGTASSDSIAAWIVDGRDNPAIHAIVDFEPFSSTPLPTEKKTLGGVKGLYR